MGWDVHNSTLKFKVSWPQQTVTEKRKLSLELSSVVYITSN